MCKPIDQLESSAIMNSLLLHEDDQLSAKTKYQVEGFKIFFVILGNVTFYMRVHESNSSDSWPHQGEIYAIVMELVK